MSLLSYCSCCRLLYLLFFLMIRRPPRSTLFPYTDALPISLPLELLADQAAALGLELRSPRADWATYERVFVEELEHAREAGRSEEHTSELQSRSDLVCRLLLEKKTVFQDLAEHCAVVYSCD